MIDCANMPFLGILGLKGLRLKMRMFNNKTGEHERDVVLVVYSKKGSKVTVEDVVESIEFAKVDKTNPSFEPGFTYLYHLCGKDRLIRL